MNLRNCKLLPNLKPKSLQKTSEQLWYKELKPRNYDNIQLELSQSLSLSLTDSSIEKRPKQDKIETKLCQQKYEDWTDDGALIEDNRSRRIKLKTHKKELKINQIQEQQTLIDDYYRKKKQRHDKYHNRHHKFRQDKDQNKNYKNYHYHSEQNKLIEKTNDLNTTKKYKLIDNLQKCPCCGKKINKLCFHCPHLFCKVQTCARKKKQVLNHRMLVKLRHNRYQELKQNSELDQQTIRRKFRILPNKYKSGLSEQQRDKSSQQYKYSEGQQSIDLKIKLRQNRRRRQSQRQEEQNYLSSSLLSSSFISDFDPTNRSHLYDQNIYQDQ